MRCDSCGISLIPTHVVRDVPVFCCIHRMDGDALLAAPIVTSKDGAFINHVHNHRVSSVFTRAPFAKEMISIHFTFEYIRCMSQGKPQTPAALFIFQLEHGMSSMLRPHTREERPSPPLQP